MLLKQLWLFLSQHMPCASCCLLVSLVREFYIYPVIFLRQLKTYQEAKIRVQIQVKPNSELMIIQSRQTRKDVTTDMHTIPFNLIQIVKKGTSEEKKDLLIFYFFPFFTWLTRVHPENSDSRPNGWVHALLAGWGTCTRLHQQAGCTLGSLSFSTTA